MRYLSKWTRQFSKCALRRACMCASTRARKLSSCKQTAIMSQVRNLESVISSMHIECSATAIQMAFNWFLDWYRGHYLFESNEIVITITPLELDRFLCDIGPNLSAGLNTVIRYYLNFCRSNSNACSQLNYLPTSSDHAPNVDCTDRSKWEITNNDIGCKSIFMRRYTKFFFIDFMSVTKLFRYNCI